MNSPKAENLKQVLPMLPAFNVEKRLAEQEKMIGKLLEENRTIYTRLCGYESNHWCLMCGSHVTITELPDGIKCDDCKTYLINYT